MRDPYIFRDRIDHVNMYDRRLYGANRRHYGFWKFMGDSFMTLLTSGLWLIWIFVREMRGRR